MVKFFILFFNILIIPLFLCVKFLSYPHSVLSPSPLLCRRHVSPSSPSLPFFSPMGAVGETEVASDGDGGSYDDSCDCSDVPLSLSPSDLYGHAPSLSSCFLSISFLLSCPLSSSHGWRFVNHHNN